MKSHEQKFAEAIQALTYRLKTWAVDDPETKAREFMRDLTHHGWRGAVAELDLPRSRPTQRADQTTRDQALADMRAKVAATKAGPLQEASK